MFEELEESLHAKIEDFGTAARRPSNDHYTPHDVSKFNSDTASKTNWNPLKPGGSNQRTHYYEEKDGIAQFKATKGSIFFVSIFIAMGLLVPFYGFYMSMTRGELFNPISLVANLAPLIFFVIGFVLLRVFTRPVIFNKHTGYFTKGRFPQNTDPQHSNLRHYCRLVDIAGIQIISERVRSSSTSGGSSTSSIYNSHELNLVLKDGSRINVIDHSRKKKLLEDASKLGEFLQVPVWDYSKGLLR